MRRLATISLACNLTHHHHHHHKPDRQTHCHWCCDVDVLIKLHPVWQQLWQTWALLLNTQTHTHTHAYIHKQHSCPITKSIDYFTFNCLFLLIRPSHRPPSQPATVFVVITWTRSCAVTHNMCGVYVPPQTSKQTFALFSVLLLQCSCNVLVLWFVCLYVI